jgi:cytoskeleton protein RodZ
MTTASSNSNGRDGREQDLFAGIEPFVNREDAMDPQTDSQATDGGRVLIDHAPSQEGHFGARLRAAREARGYTVEACGQALRLPVRLLRQLEAGEYGGIDYQVYRALCHRRDLRGPDGDHRGAHGVAGRAWHARP